MYFSSHSEKGLNQVLGVVQKHKDYSLEFPLTIEKEFGWGSTKTTINQETRITYRELDMLDCISTKILEDLYGDIYIPYQDRYEREHIKKYNIETISNQTLNVLNESDKLPNYQVEINEDFIYSFPWMRKYNRNQLISLLKNLEKLDIDTNYPVCYIDNYEYKGAHPKISDKLFSETIYTPPIHKIYFRTKLGFFYYQNLMLLRSHLVNPKIHNLSPLAQHLYRLFISCNYVGTFLSKNNKFPIRTFISSLKKVVGSTHKNKSHFRKRIIQAHEELRLAKIIDYRYKKKYDEIYNLRIF